MPTVLPSRPSWRNQEIYRIYHSHAMDQAELAQKYGITQQRVAQILKTVEKWLGTYVPRDNDLLPAERIYVAVRNSRVNLCEDRRWARKIVEQSLRPQVIITQKLKNNEVVQSDKRLKYGKCDQHIFQKMLDMRPQIEEAIKAEIAAEEAAQRARESRPEQMEDLEVLMMLEICRDIQRRVRQLRKAGIEMAPAPRFNRRQIEAHVRVQFRQHPDTYTLEILMPPEWLEVRYKLYPDTSGFRQWLGKEEEEGGEGRGAGEVESGEWGVGSEEWRVGSEEDSLVPTGCQSVVAACHHEETPPQESTSHKSAEVKKVAPKPKSESDEGTAIPEDDESYTYTDVYSEHGYIRIRRTCKKTGFKDWFIPERYRENYERYQKWLQQTSQNVPVIRLL